MGAQIVQSGQLNVAALTVPGVYIVIVPPTLLINGVPTNVVGYVGTASWGPDNQPVPLSSYPAYAGQFGNMVPRAYDMGTHVWVAYQYPNSQVVACCVRVTDGTDTAATVAIQTDCATATSKWTGSGGNNQSIQFAAGTAANSFKAILYTPNANLVETFDNVLQGVQSLTVTAGSDFTSVPGLSIAASPAGGANASAGASLTVAGVPTVTVGGTGNVVNDVLTLSNGVQLKVLTVTDGAVSTIEVINAGSITGAGTPVPSNPVAVASTTGAGTGATFTLAWALGPAVDLVPGVGYTAAPEVTLTGGGGTDGAYAAVISYWPNIVAAVNSGQGATRGPSQALVLTLGSGTAAPQAATYTLAGGTDGANISPTGSIGSNTRPYTGMYALQGQGCSIGDLCDITTPSTWTTQVAFGLANGLYMMGTTAPGDTLSNAPSELSSAGIDSYGLKMMFGDWCQINDNINNQYRYVSPQAFAAQAFGNLAPNMSSLNQQLYGVVGTQKSATGQVYQNGDIQTLISSRMDVIASPSDGGTYYSCQTGLNCASNAAVNGDNYTRMNNFLAVTYASALGPFIGTPGTPTQANEVKGALDNFMTNVQYSSGLIGDPDNPSAPPEWQSTVQQTQPNGQQFASLKVQLQAITMELVMDLQAGQTVTVNTTTAAA